jgi:hypothetical protein
MPATMGWHATRASSELNNNKSVTTNFDSGSGRFFVFV